VAVGLINVFWLLPIALCVSYWKVDGALGLVVAYLPLVWLAIKFRAGQLEDR
jgi:Fuc2NAc and GlcNAc transferase